MNEDKRAQVARLLARRAQAPRAYPLSSGQRRLWFLDRFHPGDPVYNIPVASRIAGPLDHAALRVALDTVVARHGALRTTFADSGGEPVQLVHPPRPAELTVTDLGAADPGADPAAREAEAQRLMWAEAARPFDLVTGPLLRALLVRADDEVHYLALCLHHIVADAWSLGVLHAELNAAYAAARDGTDPALAPLPTQYGEFAVWERERLAPGSEEPARRLAYWRDALAGAPALLSLPTDRPRPATRSYRGAVHYAAAGPALTARLNDFARVHQATPFMTLLAAFQALLSRYSGQPDVVVGTPVAGRSHPDVEPLIGFFVNSLPLRVSTAGSPGFAELVRRAREAVLNGLGHADVPFEKLVEELRPARSLGHAPIFQAQLIMQNAPRAELDLVGTSATSLALDSGTAKFDLTLVAVSDGDDLRLAVEYSTDLFDAATIERFVRHLLTLMDAGLADPHRPVTEIGLLSGVERWRTLVEWNATDRELPPVGSAVELLGEPNPAATAAVVTGPDGQWTAGRLHGDAARLSAVLRERGATPDSPVAICLERGGRLVTSVLGAWRAGCGYLPLDPALPADRLRYMIDDSGTRVLVTERAVRARLGAALAGVAEVVCLDDDAAVLAAADPTPPAPAHPDGLAYLIYTSGSTGRPKGVAVPHAAVVNLLAGFVDAVGLGPADRFAAVTTLSFDISVLELLLPLVTGARLTVVGAAVAADGAALRRLLAAEQITAMQATPATWRLLLAAGGVPGTLRLRLCGGEALPRDLADALRADHAALWNCYGPTETTVWSAAAEVPPAPAGIDLGVPIANTRLYVLDRAGQPVPAGVVGEVHIGGLGVARGYHGRPGLTADRFRPDPFAGRPGARLYATGDLARYRPDGRLEYLGRADHQVKVRGFRIELGEIEELLRAQPEVADAVVTTWDGGGGDVRLVAYLVPAGGTGTDAADELWAALRSRLAVRLPEYMLPTAAVPLAELPRNPNGKTDRTALPPPAWTDAEAGEYVAPDGLVAQVLAEVWRDVLGVARVGAHDDFFRLGGHSLLGAQALSRVSALFSVDVPLRALFEAPTVAALAEVLHRLEPRPGHVDEVAALHRDVAAMSDDDVRVLLGDA
ncbi:non-ribosomal peptide synthetase [Couchioplanes caeruleus]|uniref:Non-ribosomal peptide synthetase n=2 Tax=Couchioplanes caeruleus TaxID=56438 RepID=A0A1K0H2F4_9ACTN|nr:non-ribosomal peptide synthetase [Couchioplanes caeruleus]OJF15883.1 Non-ribosomal peptide synthetase [Couchioplanes caeruleus subsp. caeruleus]ROP28450.1 amino acid adenylation domain-containing protein [Couchioplanes caeruleus]